MFHYHHIFSRSQAEFKPQIEQAIADFDLCAVGALKQAVNAAEIQENRIQAGYVTQHRAGL